MAREVTFAGLQICGRDLSTLVGNTMGNAECDLVKSLENSNPEVMIQVNLNHTPGIQKLLQ